MVYERQQIPDAHGAPLGEESAPRSSRNHLKGLAKRTAENDAAFEEAFTRMIIEAENTEEGSVIREK